MTKDTPAKIGKKIIAELKDKKLLLLQDKSFPSIVAFIVGAPIQGSWWGHPLANPIYNGLNWAIDRESLLSAKLISKKVTYIDKALYPYFFSIVSEIRPWQTKGLSFEALKLYKVITKCKSGIRSDDEELKKKFPDFKKNIETLEVRLMIYTDEVHTESGKHVKEIKSWPQTKVYKGVISSYEVALEKISTIVHEANIKYQAKMKLPW
jgi:hypothetical protein